MDCLWNQLLNRKEEKTTTWSEMQATVAFCSISLPVWWEKVGWGEIKEDLSYNWKIGEYRKKNKTSLCTALYPYSNAAAAALLLLRAKRLPRHGKEFNFLIMSKGNTRKLYSTLFCSFPLQQLLEEGKAGNSWLYTNHKIHLKTEQCQE